MELAPAKRATLYPSKCHGIMNFCSTKESSMMKGLTVIVLVGALVIAAEGACTFNKWDSLDGIPFFYNSDGN